MRQPNKRNPFLESALRYLRLGYSVIPIKPNSKEPLIEWKEFQKRPPTEVEVVDWWEKYPDANLAIVTGEVSGVCVLEVDDKNILDGLEIPMTPTAVSGGKRLPHFYFLYRGGVPNFSYRNENGEAFSLRSDGSYIVIPPSKHKNGGVYKWVEGCALDDVQLSELPDWLISYMGDSVKSQIDKDLSYSGKDDKTRNEVKRLKKNIKFSELMSDLGFEGQACGKYWRYRCPFHNDGDDADFVVWDDICGAKDFHDGTGYDPIKFLMQLKGWSFKETLNHLRSETKNGTKQSSSELVEMMVDMIRDSDAILFHDQHKEAYIRYRSHGKYLISKISDEDFKLWVMKQYFDRTGKALTDSNLKAILNSLKAEALFVGNMHNLNVRVAIHDNSYWYDLGDGRAVRIDSKGWEIVDEPPILFKRFAHQQIQVEPINAPCDAIYDVFKFVRIKDNYSRLIFIANLVASLVPDIPHPIDVFYGVKGSSKTTAIKIKKGIIDPSTMSSMGPPRYPNDFIQACSHHWYIGIDNLSKLPEWLSDTLCRLVTGEGSSKRQLYTDDDDIIYSFQRCLSLNGINTVADKPDLLDRALLFELETILPDERKTEYELWAEFEKLKPIILGALFSLLSKAIAEYSKFKLKEKPRMADFAQWGCAAARALGMNEEEFLRAYQRNIIIQNDEALEGSPIAQVILVFMKDKPRWEGTPTALFEIVKRYAESNGIDSKDPKFPKGVNMIWKRIQVVQPNLREIGIECTHDDSSRAKFGRKIIIVNNMYRAAEKKSNKAGGRGKLKSLIERLKNTPVKIKSGNAHRKRLRIHQK